MQGAAAPAAPSFSQYNFQSDPAYQQALALGGQSVADAQASASAARQQALIGYGYNENLASLFGGDQNLAQSAQGNPFSYLSNLGHQYDQANTDSSQQYTDQRAALLDALNKQNLTFGSSADNSTGDLLRNYTTSQTEGARNYQGALSQGASGLQSLLGQIDSGVLQAQQNAAQQKAAAEQQAAQSSLLEALLYGTGGAGVTDPTLDPTAASGYGFGSGGMTAADYWAALARATKTNQSVGL